MGNVNNSQYNKSYAKITLQKSKAHTHWQEYCTLHTDTLHTELDSNVYIITTQFTQHQKFQATCKSGEKLFFFLWFTQFNNWQNNAELLSVCLHSPNYGKRLKLLYELDVFVGVGG